MLVNEHALIFFCKCGMSMKGKERNGKTKTIQRTAIPF